MEKQHIQQYLVDLKRRGQRFSLFQFCIGVISGGLFALLLLSFGLSFHLEYTIAVVLAALFALGTLVYRATEFSDRRQQYGSVAEMARLVEARLPSLRGRTFLVLEKTDAERGEHFLLQRAFQSVWTTLSGFPLQHFISSTALKRAGKQLLYTVVLIIIGQYALPIGPLQSLYSLKGKDGFQQQLAAKADIDPDAEVVIGDISITYIFPEYTKMVPVEIPNSNGHIQAPAGTTIQIRAKTLRAYQSASIQFNDERTEPVNLSFGRDIETTFVLSEEGQYRFLLFDGEKQLPSSRFEMEFHDDDPPIVVAELQNEKVPANRPIKIKWNASDDFGLERVVVELEKDDETYQIILKKPKQNTLELNATLNRVAKQLNLKGGDVVSVTIVAYDNQAPVDQSVAIEEGAPYGKRGESAKMKLTIMTPEMSAAEMRALNRRLRDALIPVLAEYLVEPSLPSLSPTGMVKWGGIAKKRYAPLRELVDTEWGEQWPTYLSAELISEVLRDSGTMLRYVSTTYGEGRVGEPKEKDNEHFKEMHVVHVAQLERVIFIIDRMLRQVAFQEVSERSQKLSSIVERLLNKDFEELSAAEIFALLDPVNQTMRQLNEASEELSTSTLKDFIQNRSEEIESLKEEMKKAVEAENMELARSLMEQVSASVEQFSEGLQEQLERMKQEEEKLQEEMESLIEKLKEIEEKQEALTKELELARQQEPEDIQEMVAAWEKMLKLAERAEEESIEILNLAGDGSGFRSSSLQRYDRLKMEQTGLREAIQAKYLDASINSAQLVMRRVETTQYINESETNRSRYGADKRPKSLSKISEKTSKIEQLDSQIIELLLKMQEDPVAETVEMQELAQQLSPEEAELMQQMKEAEGKVQEMEQQIPTADGSAYQFAQEATKAMKIAEDNLAKGQAMQGEGYQEQAADRVRDTIEALEQAMQQLQQMQQQMQQMSGEGEGAGAGDGEDSGSDITTADIPLEEDKMSPEEYRKALIEGMRGNVPQEFEALKKRYYEELVAQ